MKLWPELKLFCLSDGLELEVVVGSRHRPRQPRDVPHPDLIEAMGRVASRLARARLGSCTPLLKTTLALGMRQTCIFQQDAIETIRRMLCRNHRMLNQTIQ